MCSGTRHASAPQQCLYLLPEPQGQGSFRAIFWMRLRPPPSAACRGAARFPCDFGIGVIGAEAPSPRWPSARDESTPIQHDIQGGWAATAASYERGQVPGHHLAFDFIHEAVAVRGADQLARAWDLFLGVPSWEGWRAVAAAALKSVSIRAAACGLSAAMVSEMLARSSGLQASKRLLRSTRHPRALGGEQGFDLVIRARHGRRASRCGRLQPSAVGTHRSPAHRAGAG